MTAFLFHTFSCETNSALDGSFFPLHFHSSHLQTFTVTQQLQCSSVISYCGFCYFICFVFFFHDSVSLCSPVCHGTRSIDQVGFKLTNTHHLCLLRCATTWYGQYFGCKYSALLILIAKHKIEYWTEMYPDTENTSIPTSSLHSLECVDLQIACL